MSKDKPFVLLGRGDYPFSLDQDYFTIGRKIEALEMDGLPNLAEFLLSPDGEEERNEYTKTFELDRIAKLFLQKRNVLFSRCLWIAPGVGMAERQGVT